MTVQAFPGLRQHAYGAILADCPWGWLNWSGRETVPHRTEEAPYSTMAADDLKRLPVGYLAKPDCALFLWTISSHLDQAFPLAEAWGFKYRAKVFEWFKRTNDGERFRIGMGKWSRQQTETCLLFTRGKPRRLSAGVRQVIEAVPREHSRKPDEQYARIEALVAGPYVELFAKYRRVGWDGWGWEYPVSAEEQLEQATMILNRASGFCVKGHSPTMYAREKGEDWSGIEWGNCDETCIPF